MSTTQQQPLQTQTPEEGYKECKFFTVEQTAEYYEFIATLAQGFHVAFAAGVGYKVSFGY